MVYFDETKGKYVFPSEMIRYVHNDKIVCKPIGPEGKDWWFAFEQKWQDMKIMEIKPYVPADEKLKRIKVIEDFAENENSKVDYYMEHGVFPEDGNEAEEIEDAELKEIKTMQMTTMEAIADIYMLLATI